MEAVTKIALLLGVAMVRPASAGAMVALLLLPAASAVWADTPVPLTRYPAEYPYGATGEGAARVTLAIDENGQIVRAKVASDTPEGKKFEGQALYNALHWTFEPGHPGPFSVTMKFVPPETPPPQPEFSMCGLDGSQDTMRPEAVERQFPQYPKIAESLEIEGATEVLVKVDETGKAIKAAVIWEGPTIAGFGQSSLESIARWRFEPGRPGYICIRQIFLLHG